jgi:hypothetical protein
MTDITEAQTIEYFMQGARKAKSAARELAKLNQTHAWTAIRSQLGMLEKNAHKIYNDKPQTRLQTLDLAMKISGDAKH